MGILYLKESDVADGPLAMERATKRDKREAYRKFEDERHDGPWPRRCEKQLIYAAGREVAESTCRS